MQGGSVFDIAGGPDRDLVFAGGEPVCKHEWPWEMEAPAPGCKRIDLLVLPTVNTKFQELIPQLISQ